MKKKFILENTNLIKNGKLLKNYSIYLQTPKVLQTWKSEKEGKENFDYYSKSFADSDIAEI